MNGGGDSANETAQEASKKRKTTSSDSVAADPVKKKQNIKQFTHAALAAGTAPLLDGLKDHGAVLLAIHKRNRKDLALLQGLAMAWLDHADPKRKHQYAAKFREDNPTGYVQKNRVELGELSGGEHLIFSKGMQASSCPVPLFDMMEAFNFLEGLARLLLESILREAQSKAGTAAAKLSTADAENLSGRLIATRLDGVRAGACSGLHGNTTCDSLLSIIVTNSVVPNAGLSLSGLGFVESRIGPNDVLVLAGSHLQELVKDVNSVHYSVLPPADGVTPLVRDQRGWYGLLRFDLTSDKKWSAVPKRSSPKSERIESASPVKGPSPKSERTPRPVSEVKEAIQDMTESADPPSDSSKFRITFELSGLTQTHVIVHGSTRVSRLLEYYAGLVKAHVLSLRFTHRGKALSVWDSTLVQDVAADGDLIEVST